MPTDIVSEEAKAAGIRQSLRYITDSGHTLSDLAHRSINRPHADANDTFI
jgi:hypothetical protein